MTALAPTLQAFFTDRLIRPAPRQPAHHRRLPRHAPAAARLRRRAHQQAHRPRWTIADLDAPLIGGVPRPPRTRARQQRPHPQRPAGRDPLAVPLRRAAPPRTRRRASHGSWPSRPNAATGRWSPTSPSPRSTRCSPRPTAATWTGRRDHALLLLAVQTGLRISELIGLHPRRRAPRRRGAHVACHGKGRKDRITPLTRNTVSRAARLARPNAPAHPSDAAVPDPPRPPAQPRRHRTSPRPLHRPGRRTRCPSLHRQEDHRARPAAHRRDAASARRRRHHRDRALARLRREAQRCIARAAGRDERRYLWI